jgi:cell division protein FtsB
MLATSIDSLKRDIDSLRSLKRRIETDPATQERIAREEFGMVRGDKELLFRFLDPDSLRR